MLLYLVRSEHDELSRDATETLLLILRELVVTRREEGVEV